MEDDEVLIIDVYTSIFELTDDDFYGKDIIVDKQTDGSYHVYERVGYNWHRMERWNVHTQKER